MKAGGKTEKRTEREADRIIGIIHVFEGMIICGCSKNPFLSECEARVQERILRAPADDHVREKVYFRYYCINK
ncbi:hypothetical protein DPMN_104591 [Dreissena polymorpha]|uniref:Uncharacterized protein n=1 Tax=Dreissena polymorpha TaxID=45954 RepID=A0A9D4HCB1_DREPO|nr:hypothetical protein DPMN_104591 [Dreissena polymorpha]